MKRTTILSVAVIAMSLMILSWTKLQKLEAAVRIDDFGCGLFNGDGGGTWTDNSHAVITYSGNGNITCKATGVANNTGKAAQFDFASTGAMCGTLNGVTDEWHETVSANGNATLSCQNHPQ